MGFVFNLRRFGIWMAAFSMVGVISAGLGSYAEKTPTASIPGNRQLIAMKVPSPAVIWTGKTLTKTNVKNNSTSFRVIQSPRATTPEFKEDTVYLKTAQPMIDEMNQLRHKTLEWFASGGKSGLSYASYLSAYHRFRQQWVSKAPPETWKNLHQQVLNTFEQQKRFFQAWRRADETQVEFPFGELDSAPVIHPAVNEVHCQVNAMANDILSRPTQGAASQGFLKAIEGMDFVQ